MVVSLLLNTFARLEFKVFGASFGARSSYAFLFAFRAVVSLVLRKLALKLAISTQEWRANHIGLTVVSRFIARTVPIAFHSL